MRTETPRSLPPPESQRVTPREADLKQSRLLSLTGTEEGPRE